MPNTDPLGGQPLRSDLCQLASDYRRVSQAVRDSDVSQREALRTALAVARRTVAYDAAVVAYRRPAGGSALRVVALDNHVEYFEDNSAMPPVPNGIFAEAIGRQCPLAWSADDLSSDPSTEQLPWLAQMCCALSVPIQGVEGDDAAAVIFRRTDAPFSQDEQRLSVIQMNLMAGLLQTSLLRERLLKANAALDEEFRAVAAIQHRLLPSRIPDVAGLDIAVRYEASSRAGGDYYDFFPLPDGRLGVLIADVSGHGAVAAVVMAMTRALLHADPDPPSPPAQLLNRLNAKLVAQRPVEQFVTAFYGIFDPANGVLSYACAGHPPPRLKRCGTGDIVPLDKAVGVPLAVLDDPLYTGAEASIGPGDVSVCFTDGITEVFNPEGAMFGITGLERELPHCPSDTAAEIVTYLVDAADRFAAGQVRHDDRTVLVIKVEQ